MRHIVRLLAIGLGLIAPAGPEELANWRARELENHGPKTMSKRPVSGSGKSYNGWEIYETFS